MAERSFWRRGGAAETAFRRLFAAAPEALALLDAGGRILAANAALRDLAGPGLPLRQGMDAALLLAEAGRPLLAEAMRRGSGVARTLEAKPADPLAPADSCWQCMVGPLEGSDSLVLRVRDVTAARRTEARLASGARLETVGRLAGGIAHDFNNLLTAILGSAEVLRGFDLPLAALAELAQIEDASRRGAGLVRQLLAFARQQTLQPKVLSLNEAVRSIAPLLGRLLGAQVQLDLRLEEPGRLVRVDPGQLDQVLLNLAVNARDAMQEGGRLMIATGHAVLLRAEGMLPPGRYAVLEVADTGIGMPSEVVARIFEPFFSTKGAAGTGLGLATVQGILAQSGGHIAVDSAPGQGTRFRIHLPRYEGREAASQSVEVQAAATSTLPHAVREGRLLLVEDEVPLRRLAQQALTRAGHAVVAAESAEAALERVADGLVPVALVTDVSMPGMDGLALARELRRRWPELPVVLLSGYAAGTIGADLAAEGMIFLAKPFTPSQLCSQVERSLAAEFVP